MLYALWVVAGVLLLVWMLGVAGALAVGNGIHFLLLIAILAVVSSLFTRPRVMERLARKHQTARTLVPPPTLAEDAGAEVGLIAYGSTHSALVEARDQLRAQGIPTGYLLVRALPFAPQVEKFLARYSRVYVVEQNRDGQMAELLRAEMPEQATKIRSVRHFTGLPIPAGFVTTEILAQEGATPGKTAARQAEGVIR